MSYDRAIYEELGSSIALPIYETALMMEGILLKIASDIMLKVLIKIIMLNVI